MRYRKGSIIVQPGDTFCSTYCLLITLNESPARVVFRWLSHIRALTPKGLPDARLGATGYIPNEAWNIRSAL